MRRALRMFGFAILPAAPYIQKSKEEGTYHESIQLSTTPDPRHDIGKRQKHKETSHTREPRGQPFQSGDHKAARNRQDSTTKTSVKYKYQKGSTKEAPP